MNDSLALLTSRPAVTDSVTLALDPNDAQRLREARSAVHQAERVLERANTAAARDGAGDDKRQAVDKAETDHADAVEALALLEASLVTFTVHLKAIGVRRYEELLLEHRPTQQQQQQGKRLGNGDPQYMPQFDTDRFPPALLAEAVDRIEFSNGAEPITSLSLSQAGDLWNSPWPQGDRALVLQTAQMLNQVSSLVEDLGKG